MSVFWEANRTWYLGFFPSEEPRGLPRPLGARTSADRRAAPAGASGLAALAGGRPRFLRPLPWELALWTVAK